MNKHNALPHEFFAILASQFGVDEIEGITIDEIETRADYFVGGFYSMGFIALAMFC